jgi:hypothetical protein
MLAGEGGREGKIKGLSRDARQVFVCTSFFEETAARRARWFVSRRGAGADGDHGAYEVGDRHSAALGAPPATSVVGERVSLS